MFKAVIEGPMGREGVEEIVFNLPSAVAYPPELAAGEFGEGKGGGPPPVMEFGRFDPFLRDAPSSGERFFCMEDPQRSFNSFDRGKSFGVPQPDLLFGFFPEIGFHLSKQTLSILKKSPLFPFEDHHDLLPMVNAEVDEGGFKVEGIPDNPVEETTIGLGDTFQESFCRDHLSFPWQNHLHV